MSELTAVKYTSVTPLGDQVTTRFVLQADGTLREDITVETVAPSPRVKGRTHQKNWP